MRTSSNQNIFIQSVLLASLLAPIAGGCGAPAPESAKTGDDPIEEPIPLRAPAPHRLGPGGGVCETRAEPANVEVLDGLQVRSAKYVDGLRMRYRNRATGHTRWTDWLGGFGGKPQPEFGFTAGEKLIRIDVMKGATIDKIKFTTNQGHVYGPFGGNGGGPDSFETAFEGSERREIHGFRVNFCKDIDGGNQIGALTAIDYLPCETCGSIQSLETHDGWGGLGGHFFTFDPIGDESLAAIQVRTNSSGWLSGLRANYRRPSGERRWTDWAGTTGDLKDEFHFDPGEVLIGAEVRGFKVITGLKFWTSNGRFYGPFGDTGAMPPFIQEGRVHGGLRRVIQGFSGFSGDLLDYLRITDNFGQCGHFPCVQGAPLQASCDPCVQRICAADPFCCSTQWDSICQGEVASECGLTCNQN